MDAETPGIVTFDVPSIEFDHLKGTWTPTNSDVFQMVEDTRYLAGLGQAAVTVCPPCAFFLDGACHWCPGPYDPDYPSPHPECSGCLGAQPQEEPWYRRRDVMMPVLTSVLVAIVATVASSVILKRLKIQA